MKKEKEKVYINEIITEDSFSIYFLGNFEAWDKFTKRAPASICGSGYFYDTYNLDNFLDDYRNGIEIVKDCRD